MNFAETVSYLLSLGNEVSAMKLGLENIRALLAELGDPQRKYLKVQVAGTNGKGSVCAFLDAICLSANIKRGVFTSPHLVSITERIRINGSEISEAHFALVATHVRETAENMLVAGKLKYLPTFFEQITAIALVAFAKAGVELAILETGLGGRLDATTAANAEIAAITRIDYDHQEYLGETITEIAGEKAAIIHDGSDVIVAEQTSDVDRVLREHYDRFTIEPKLAAEVRSTCGSERLNFETQSSEYQVADLGLRGRHQIENAKVAILVAESLREYFPITTANIIDGLENAEHPGRLEYRNRYLFDGAHNAGGAKALAAYLDELGEQPITMIFGAMSGKDIAGIAELLFTKADKLILTRPENSRALSAEELLAFVSGEIDRSKVVLTHSVADALEKAEEIAGEDHLILITGSLYLVGEAKKILNN